MTTQDANFQGSSEAPPPVGDEETNGIAQEIAEIITSNIGWLKLLAYISIIYGILICLTIIGIIIGWLFIWVGSVLLKACSSAKNAAATGSTFNLHKSLDNIGLFFKIYGIVSMISIIVFAVVSIVGIASLSLL